MPAGLLTAPLSIRKTDTMRESLQNRQMPVWSGSTSASPYPLASSGLQDIKSHSLATYTLWDVMVSAFLRNLSVLPTLGSPKTGTLPVRLIPGTVQFPPCQRKKQNSKSYFGARGNLPLPRTVIKRDLQELKHLL
jgi:hypothetical protein